MSKEHVERTKKFAIRIIKLVQTIPDDKVANVLGKQVLRSGISVGANYRSALRGRSTKDFLSRVTIAEEEADETVYWLELLTEAGIVTEKITNVVAGSKRIDRHFNIYRENHKEKMAK